MSTEIDPRFTQCFRGPRASHVSSASLVETNDGVVLICRGGFRDEQVFVFTLGANGFDQGLETSLKPPYYGAFGFYDGERVFVGVRERDGSLVLEDFEGARRTIAGALPDTRVRAAFDHTRGTPIFSAGQVVYDVHDGKLVPRVTLGRGITSLIFAEGRLLALTGGNEVVAIHADGATVSSTFEGESMGTLAWDANRQVLVTLIGEERTVPISLEDGEWVEGEPIDASLRYAAILAFHRVLGRVVVFGGADSGRSMRPERNEVFVLGGPALTSPFSRRAGRRNVVAHVDGEILLVNASDLSVDRWTSEGFVPYARCAWNEGPREGLDDRYVRISGGRDAIWLVRHDGATFRTANGVYARSTVAVPDALAERRGGELAWDATRDRVLLLGGHRRNDAWALDASGWHAAEHAPWTNKTELVETPSGIFAVEDKGEIWHLSAAGWGRAKSCVIPRRTYVRRVVYEPRRDALLLLTMQGGAKGTSTMWLVVGDEAREVAELPRTFRDALIDNGCFIVDTRTDRLMLFHENEIHAFDLSGLGSERIGLPRSEPYERPERPSITRPAVQLVPTARHHAIDAVPISDDYAFLAWLPASEHLPLGGHASIAIGMVDDLFAQDPSDIFSSGFTVVLLDHAPEGPVVHGPKDTVIAEMIAFEDPDPTMLEEMDATSGWDRATKTKIGGYPRPIQGGSEEAEQAQTSSPCRTCDTPMRFVVQLSGDLFDIGDSGRALVYVCPNGCDAGATADCH